MSKPFILTVGETTLISESISYFSASVKHKWHINISVAKREPGSPFSDG